STFSAYVMILLAGYAYEFHQRYQNQTIRAERLRSEMIQAQLRALRMQTQPHFLFNTLHTISALVRECPAAAVRTIAQLSDLLRHTLETGGHSLIPLCDELHSVELYLEIERTRFEERLAVRIDVDHDLNSIRVPGFILQPLVENAVRHGIARCS